MTFPKVGNLAPTFTLPDQDGSKVKLQDFRNQKNVVVYFYPKAMTPGCTVQAGGLRDSAAELAKRNTVVFGVWAVRMTQRLTQWGRVPLTVLKVPLSMRTSSQFWMTQSWPNVS